MVALAVMRFVEHQERNVRQAHEAVLQGVCQDGMGANHDPNVKQHLIPGILGGPELASIISREQLRRVGRQLAVDHPELVLSKSNFWAQEPDTL